MRFPLNFFYGLILISFSFPCNADGINTISKTNKLLKKADNSFKIKDYKNAIKSYEEALKESSEVPPQANLNLGLAYLQTKDFQKAQKNYLTAATSLSSPNLKSIAYQQIGNIFSQQKDYKSAVDWYKKSLLANPENEAARFNYELAYKLNKQKEEQEKKENPNNDKQKPENQKDKKQGEKDQEKGKEGNEKNQNDKKDSSEKNEEQNKKDAKQGPQQGKGPDSKNNQEAKKGDDPNAKEGDKESSIGKEKNMKEEDKEGKEESKNKKEESNIDDPNALRVDKKKLQETGLSESQAKSLLEAMKQSEVKYLQQRRFKSPKGGTDKNKPRW